MTKPTHRIVQTGVEITEKASGRYLVGTEIYSDYDIKKLGLTLEPIVRDKKKLFAFEHPDGSILFYQNEVGNLYARKPLIRKPEYDILYPEE